LLRFVMDTLLKERMVSVRLQSERSSNTTPQAKTPQYLVNMGS